MYDKENNRITKEIVSFGGHGWKSWDDNRPTVTLYSNDGYGNHVDHFLTIDQTVELIDLLETFIAQAKEAKDNEPMQYPVSDDTPF